MDEDVGMGGRRVREQPLAVEHEKLVDSVGKDLVFNLAPDARTGHHGVELDSELRSEFPSFGKQLLGDLRYGRPFNFTIYEYVVHMLSR